MGSGRVTIDAQAGRQIARSLALIAALVGVACSKDNAVDASQTTECGDNTLDCVPCEAGEHRCVGAVLKTCQADGQGFDAVMSCVTEALCVKGLPDKTCAVPACNAADTKCDGARMIVCASGRDELEVTECPSAASCTSGLKDGRCGAGECAVAQECSGVDSECRKRTCDSGVCGWQDLAPGTISTTQEEGDCKRRICDGQGGVVAEPLPTDVHDDGNDCTIDTCEGPAPKSAWASEGTACQGTGVCDGAGKCVACIAGTKACNGNEIKTCQPSGQWDLGTACVSSACVNGACVGACEPGLKQCSGQVPQTCSTSGVWEGAAECPDSACVGGECVGSCAPQDTKCDGNGVLTCDAEGSWVGTECVSSACVGGICVGNCVPGLKQCSGRQVQTCDASGAWQAGQTCDELAICLAGDCVPIPSCTGLASNCGPTGNESCCASAIVPAGSYPMGRSLSGTDQFSSGGANELPEHTATISAFRLELYEVTVGRFRKFVEAYPGNKPVAGAGANPSVSGTGWNTGWDNSLPSDQDALKATLKCSATYQTWRDTASGTENLPINCASWFETFAFCAWDGGWLPTEAEWEKAAAGGDENRLYPWGQTAPDATLAVYECTGDGSAANQCAFGDVLAVGSKPAGKGRWGHYDLAGNMMEWVLDWYSDSWYGGAGNPCNDCANAAAASGRVVRDGYFGTPAGFFRAAYRSNYTPPTNRSGFYGFRCARTP